MPWLDSPAPGTKIPVNAGGDLQAALTALIVATRSNSKRRNLPRNVRLPAKSCDSGHWVIVRTSAPDSALPPRGSADPCYAGVTFCRDVSPYACSNPQNVVARLIRTRTGMVGGSPSRCESLSFGWAGNSLGNCRSSGSPTLMSLSDARPIHIV